VAPFVAAQRLPRREGLPADGALVHHPASRAGRGRGRRIVRLRGSGCGGRPAGAVPVGRLVAAEGLVGRERPAAHGAPVLLERRRRRRRRRLVVAARRRSVGGRDAGHAGLHPEKRRAAQGRAARALLRLSLAAAARRTWRRR